MDDELTRAETLRQAAFGPALDALRLVRPGHPWYVNLDEMLSPDHYGVASRIDARFREAPVSEHLHLALLGQGGTGKSTLVREAMLGLRDIGILPVYINASESFDRSDMHFADVVLVLVEAIVRELVDRHETIELAPSLLERVRRWFADEVVGETQRREILGTMESSAAVEGGIPGLAKLASSVKGTLRSENDYRREIRQKAARNPEELVAGANDLLAAVHVAFEARKQRICVVFDNLEKVHDRQQIYRAFLSRAEDLRRLRCHAIYFLSPAEQYAPLGVQANQAFTCIEMPAIPIRRVRTDRLDFVHDEALGAITKILERRVNIHELAESPTEVVRAIARWSGGHLRDVLELARQACEFAHYDRSTDRLGVTHVERAVRKLAALRLTAMTPECWPRAREIHRGHAVADRPEDARMLSTGLVLAYDGQPWWDVHPFLAADPRFSSEA